MTPSSGAGDGPVKVLRVIGRLNMGGPALHVSYLADGLRRRGYETTLVAGTLARGEESMAFVADDLGVDVVQLRALRREVSPLADAFAVLRLVRIMRRERPQILHTHTAKAGAVGRVAALFAGVARPPIVLHTFHGHVLEGYFGSVRASVFRAVERWLARPTTALVAVSPDVRDDLVRLGVAPARKFAIVRLGIELEQRTAADGETRAATRRALGIGEDRYMVGWIGRLAPVKRVEDLLLAFKRIREQGVDACLCIVGDGPERVSIERRARKLGIARDCLFLNYQRDIGRFYAAFDVFALPSASEGTPVTAIEALAAGRPVVATRVGGVPDVVRDGIDGFLVDRGAVDQLAERLVLLARDHDLRRRLGSAGRSRVLSRYAVRRLVDDVDLLYRSLLTAQSVRG